MKIAVIGAGAIGGLVAGYLKLKGQEISLVAHSDSVKAIKENGLGISGVRGEFNIKIDASERLGHSPDLVILTTKTQDINTALLENRKFIQDAVILTTQNGIQADSITAQYVPKENIISSIVMFGSTRLEPAQIVHNFEGSWIISRPCAVLDEVFSIVVTPDLIGMKYLKIFVNANNCIPAILGVSMQEAFNDIEVSRVSIAIWKEGLEVIRKAGINLVSLPDFPLERVVKLTSLPIYEAAKIYSGIMNNLSREPIYGSILQSIKMSKPSEIDYINGEFVNIAHRNNSEAPINTKLVEMVHQVEKTNRFFSKEELTRSVERFISN